MVSQGRWQVGQRATAVVGRTVKRTGSVGRSVLTWTTRKPSRRRKLVQKANKSFSFMSQTPAQSNRQSPPCLFYASVQKPSKSAEIAGSLFAEPHGDNRLVESIVFAVDTS